MREVERRRRVGERPDRDQLDPGRRDLGDVGERDPAGGLEPGIAAGGVAGGDRRAQRRPASMLSSSSRSAPAASASATSSRSRHSTSISSSGWAPATSSTAAPSPPASATWFSLIRIASSSPSRWLRPPPAATAAFSSARSPGVVLRVSRISRPGASHGLDEAGGQGGDAGEVAEQVERRPLAGEQRPRRAGDHRDLRRDRVAPLALGRERLEALGAGLANASAAASRPKIDAGLPSARSEPGPGRPRGRSPREVTSPAPRSSASARATSSRSPRRRPSAARGRRPSSR